MQMGEQGDAPLDHGEGSGNDDGAPPQGCSPMTLLSVVALQGDGLALTLIGAADHQHQRINAIAIGAEQTHFPVREALEQTPEGPFIAVTAFSVNQPSGRAVVSICLQMSGVVLRGFEPVKAARQDGDEGNPDERDQACVRSFEDRVQSAVAAEPGKRPLDDPSKAGRNEGAFCATGLGVDGNTQVKALSLQCAASIRQVTKRFAAKSTRRYRFETWKDTRRVMSIGRRYNNG
jgi:hypothetical protein